VKSGANRKKRRDEGDSQGRGGNSLVGDHGERGGKEGGASESLLHKRPVVQKSREGGLPSGAGREKKEGSSEKKNV